MCYIVYTIYYKFVIKHYIITHIWNHSGRCICSQCILDIIYNMRYIYKMYNINNIHNIHNIHNTHNIYAIYAVYLCRVSFSLILAREKSRLFFLSRKC